MSKSKKVNMDDDLHINEQFPDMEPDPANEPMPLITESQASKNEEKKQPAEEKSGFCVYLGPSIRGHIVSGTVFDTAKTAVLIELSTTIAKFPLVADLIVPGAELPQSRLKIKSPGNLLNANYHKLVGQLRKLGG
jgi:hypothetical protein